MRFGSSVIAKLIKSNIKRNLFFQMKERVVEEQIINGGMHRRQQMVKVYGLDSSKNVRDELYDLVTDRVNYHKDKVIDARIHEELCQLIYTKKGRIDHPEGGHDDLIIAWALALYVLYRGGDIANQFGITRHNIKTDSELDEEVYDVNVDAEVISDKIEVLGNPEAQVEEQLQILDNTPGKMSYEEWRQSEFKREQEAVEKILLTKDGREAYAKAYNIDENDIKANTLFRMPDSIYTDYYYDEKPDMGVGAGNMYQKFLRLMNVR